MASKKYLRGNLSIHECQIRKGAVSFINCSSITPSSQNSNGLDLFNQLYQQ